MPRLWILMEDIFGETNHLGTVAIRNNPKGRMTKRKFSLIHEYAIFFGKTKKSFIKKLPIDPSKKSHNYKKDENGNWYLPVNLRKQGVDSNAMNIKGKLSDRYYPIYFDPKTKKISTEKKLKIEILPIDSRNEKRIWRRGKDKINQMYKQGELEVKKTKYGHQVYFKFRGGIDGRLAQSIWYDSKFSASEYGTRTLDNILGKREVFQYPKSPMAVKESILASSKNTDAIILDFFAGSGTTGHAVLEMNKEDGGNRQFILCTNNENNICEEVTYERVRKVIKGYSFNGKKIEGLGGNLRYFKTKLIKQSTNKPTDSTKAQIMKNATDVLCVKENAFEKIIDKKGYKIFKGFKIYMGIIFQSGSAFKFREEIEKISENNFNIYIFSLTGDAGLENLFKNSQKKIKIIPVPEAILKVYRRIFYKRG